VIARFEAERQALALMDHQNIARVLDTGTTECGRPYFAMELVHGVPITRYCDEARLAPRERIELFVPVCQAIQHAHQKGIIHRDLKPSNVLVTLYDGKPVAKVIDFGIAKAIDQSLTDRTMFTRYGTLIGTYEYMSPEQAEMSALGVDTRSDVYSLGVMLYELLTGTTPLEGEKLRQAGFTDMLKMIREEEPPRPSSRLSSVETLSAIAAARKTEPAKLARMFRGELDWIVMRCLEKDRTRRYETANALARDLQRYLDGDPVEACPPSAGYRLRRFARKYRAALTAAAAFVGLLVVGVVISTWLAVRATAARREAEDAQKALQLAAARRVAERLDGELRQLGIVGEAMACTLEARPRWTGWGLEKWLKRLLRQDERVHGLSVAFQPHQFEPWWEDYCLYVYRPGSTEIKTKVLVPGEYNPVYRKWDWYKKPFNERRAQWVGPFFDEGGGDVQMVCYCVPFGQGREPTGVVTVDLPVAWFNDLWSWLKQLNLGEKSYGFVMTRTGDIISHPHIDGQMWRRPGRKEVPPNIKDLAGDEPEFAQLARRMMSGEAGSGTAIDPTTGKRSTFLFAPVGRQADWTFVAVIPR
jgi:hypothetical protein